jgi:diaminopimelate decarboxylase
MAIETRLSQAFPLDSRVNEHGHLEIGGCDAIELAREYGTPAYVVAEEDLRARSRAFLQAVRQSGHEDFKVVFASKSFPCGAVLSLLAREGLWCDVASSGELHLALTAGFPAKRIVVHGNAKSPAELQTALDARVGLIVIDNFDELERLHALCSERRLDGEPGEPQAVLLRATPDVRGDTHEKISTGQADSKFGFGMDEIGGAIAQAQVADGLELQGIHVHVGSQLLDLDPFRRAAAAVASIGDFPVWDLGGGLGVSYTATQPQPPSIESYVQAVVQAAREHGMSPCRRLLIEPGRSLVANSCVTLYTVQSVKRNVSHWVAVDGGMSDNLRPMLYGATYEAHVADRIGGGDPCVLAGKHCESGDIIVKEALLDDPRPGDIIVTPATGAYGYAMSNNYNGVPRAPVIFCRDGDARVVVRRETFEDLLARDVS